MAHTGIKQITLLMGLLLLSAMSLLLASAGCGAGKECMPGTKRCNSENNVELCAKDQKSWEFNKQCPKVQTCRGGQCIVEPKSCGDGTCQAKEGCNLCPQDCGACCGNGQCEAQFGEDRYTCKGDCKPLDKGIPPGGDKGTTPGKDGSTPGEDKGGVKPCTPGSVFCVGSEIRECAKDGKSAAVQQDCKTMNIPGVSYSCKQCSSGTPSCDPGSKAFLTGVCTSRTNFSFTYRGYFTCDKQKAFASMLFQGSTLTHMVTPNGVGSMPILTIQLKNASSTQSRPLVLDASAGTPVHTVSMVHSTSPSVSCTNLYTSVNPPPSTGSIKVTFSGTAKGSTVRIRASGHLLCYDGGQGSWESFTYNADGIVF